MSNEDRRDMDVKIPRGTSKRDRLSIILAAITEHGPSANLTPRIDPNARPALPKDLSDRELRKLRRKK